MDKELAARFLPHIYFDENEPFFPVLVGVTVFDGPGRSPSFNRSFDFKDPALGKVIEYAIYWDYDIGHLYELEHIWVYVDRDGGLYGADASFHGGYMKALLPDRSNIEDETHVVAYSQPGKHAFFPAEIMMNLLPDIGMATGKNAGSQGLLQTMPFRDCYEINDERNRIVERYLQRFAFIPSMKFARHDMPPEILTDWPGLYKAVPQRIEAELVRIRQVLGLANKPFAAAGEQKKNTVLFLDSGDTIIDEGTEIRNDFGEVISAKTLPGAKETIRELYNRGYRICLVADGKFVDFKNMMLQNGIHDCFEAFVVSESVRAEKPSPKMFRAAMGAMLLNEKDVPRIVMVGNNLSRDIKGANSMGITSVHIRWSPRYPHDPQDDSERPAHVIKTFPELLELAEKLG